MHVPYGGREPAEYERLLQAKLEPWRIRATLSFAGLYQIVHEMIKYAVMEQVRQFYWCGFDETGHLYDEAQYKRQVLDLVTRTHGKVNRFQASLRWLVKADAINDDQAERLADILAHRHALTHEMLKFVVDPDAEPDLQLFLDALTILRDIHRFWTQVEIDIGTFEAFGDVTPDDAVPSSLIVLQMCIDAYAEGLTAAGPNPDRQSATPTT